jgi:hemoglobin
MTALLSRRLAGALLAVALTATARAEDAKALSHKDLDDRIQSALYDAISAGAKTFNDGDEAGCSRLYQGALMATVPLLDHRPQLKKSAAEKMAKAQAIQDAGERAFALRGAIDEIRTTIRKDMPAAALKPLWDRLGGESIVRQVVRDVLKLAMADPAVNFSRGGKFKPTPEEAAKGEQKLVDFLSSVTGGPLKYTGRDMKTAHAGQGITNAEFDALGRIVEKVLREYRAGDTQIRELKTIIEGFRKDIVEEKPLWERLGGETGVRALTQEFLATAAKDPKVNVDRNGNYPLTPARKERVERLIVEFISSVTGGPLKYTGRDMKNTHQGMKITEAEFDAAGKHLANAMVKLKVPPKEIGELVDLVLTVKKDIVEK